MSVSHRFAPRLAATAVASAMLLLAAPTQAAVVGSFDPQFNGNQPNLGFRGTFALDVSQGCYTEAQQRVASGYGSYAFAGEGNCTMTMDYVDISYYNYFYNPTGDPAGLGGTLAEVDLAASFFDPSYVMGAAFDPYTNTFAGFDTNDSTPFTVNVPDTETPSAAYNGSMVLYFESGVNPYQSPYPIEIDPAFLVDCNANDSDETCTRSNGDLSNPAVVTINATTPTTIPEPATIPLTLLGLAGLAFARRRARKASIGASLAG